MVSYHFDDDDDEVSNYKPSYDELCDVFNDFHDVILICANKK